MFYIEIRFSEKHVKVFNEKKYFIRNMSHFLTDINVLYKTCDILLQIKTFHIKLASLFMMENSFSG